MRCISTKLISSRIHDISFYNLTTKLKGIESCLEDWMSDKESERFSYEKTADIIILLSGTDLKGGEKDVGENTCTSDCCGSYGDYSRINK